MDLHIYFFDVAGMEVHGYRIDPASYIRFIYEPFAVARLFFHVQDVKGFQEKTII